MLAAIRFRESVSLRETLLAAVSPAGARRSAIDCPDRPSLDSLNRIVVIGSTPTS